MLQMWVVRERELKMICLTRSQQMCISTIRKLLIMNHHGKLYDFP